MTSNSYRLVEVSVVNAAIDKFKEYWTEKSNKKREEIINGMIRPASWFRREITREDAIEMINHDYCDWRIKFALIYADYTKAAWYEEILGLEHLLNVSNSSSDKFDKVYLSSEHARSLARFF